MSESVWPSEEEVFSDLTEWWDHILEDSELDGVNITLVMSKRLAERHAATFKKLQLAQFEARCVSHNEIRVAFPDSLKCWKGWTQDVGPTCRIVQTLVIQVST